MIEKVKIKNWKSHHETELEFSEGVNALIGTMGSGKSSVLEAIVFGFFGTTPSHNSRDVTLDDLIRRNPSPAEKAEIEVWFSIEGENYSVKREIERDKGTTHSELRKDGELIEAPSTREVTEQVEKLLGLGFKAFTRAIYSEQNNLDLFLEMRPGDRKEKLDELLDIDRFEDARKTMVKVENNLEGELERYQDELEEVREEIDEEELDELEEDIEDRKEKLEQLQEERKEIKEEIEKYDDRKEELEEKKEKAEKLEKRKTKFETKKETSEKDLEKAREKLEGYENPEKELEEARQRKEELEEKKEKLGKLKQKQKYRRKEIEELEEEIEELEEQAEKFQEMEDIEDELEDLDDEIEEIKEEGNAKYAERENLEESIETLKDTDGECPTCGQEMDEQHRDEVLEERKQRTQELKKKEKQLREKHDELDERREKLQEKRDKLLEYKSSGKELEEKSEELEEKKEQLEELNEDIEQLEEDFSEEKLDNLEEKIGNLEYCEEKEELEEKLEHIDEKIDEIDNEMADLEFDEEKLEKLREKISELKEKRAEKKQKAKSEKELIKEKEKRLEQMQKQVEKKEELERKVEKLDHVIDYAFEYRSGLEKTQVQLREMFVEQLNRKMDGIWSKIYPYDDYYSIRLNAEEDYLVEVLDSDNNWVSAEAEVSGGERHSAALVMRLALAFTLSPKLPTLMLDEPTHNMDSSAVEELAETLRQNSSDLIKQLFIVTHDPSLESAATGKLYQLEKKNTETGLTQVEEIK